MSISMEDLAALIFARIRLATNTRTTAQDGVRQPPPSPTTPNPFAGLGGAGSAPLAGTPEAAMIARNRDEIGFAHAQADASAELDRSQSYNEGLATAHVTPTNVGQGGGGQAKHI